MTSFLTVKEAAQRTGKSPSSIRRIIYPVIKNDAHPDRTHVHPTIEEVAALRIKGENFAWRLSEDLLQREVPLESDAEKGSPSMAKQSPHPEGDLLVMLRRELDIKNQQITDLSQLVAKQMEVMTGLGERIREGNILVASLQQRLPLTDGRQSTTPETPKTKRTPSTLAEKGSTISAKTTKPKRGFFSRLFR